MPQRPETFNKRTADREISFAQSNERRIAFLGEQRVQARPIVEGNRLKARSIVLAGRGGSGKNGGCRYKAEQKRFRIHSMLTINPAE